MHSPLPPAIFLMGPTASGKTDLALALAQWLNTEIISVDSALVYRGMDIGTAKPEPSVLARIPHHLIDILDPAAAYSAAQFRSDALARMQQLTQQGKVPLLVGGTLLYFKALEHGLSQLPEANPVVRARLDAERLQQGAMAQHQRLQALDPETAHRLHPHDSQRIQRALEVYELTGQTLTQHYVQSQTYSLPYQCHKLILCPADRSQLHQRIASRFQTMLAAGLIAEVQALRARTDLDLAKPAMRAVGYRQVWQYLDGDLTYPQMVEAGISASRQLAKRQLTWLRAITDAAWFDSTDPALLPQVLTALAGVQPSSSVALIP